MVACNLGNRKLLLSQVILKFAERSGINLPPNSFSFTAAPNKLTIEKIRKKGVKRITFNVENYLGAFDLEEDNAFTRVFGRQASEKDLRREEMFAELVIRPSSLLVGKNLRAQPISKKQWLDDAAVKVFEDEDIESYTIVLNDDSRYNSGELKLSKKVRVRKRASSFNTADALQEMLNYLDEVKRLDQLD